MGVMALIIELLSARLERSYEHFSILTTFELRFCRHIRIQYASIDKCSRNGSYSLKITITLCNEIIFERQTCVMDEELLRLPSIQSLPL